MGDMPERILAAETERMMKIQEVILKAMAGKLKWWEAAGIIGITDRTMRRWRERTVNRDNTVPPDNRVFQMEKTGWRNTLAGMTASVHEPPDGSVTMHYGPHTIMELAAGQMPPQAPRRQGTPGLPYPKAA